jgi:hypothetical protein
MSSPDLTEIARRHGVSTAAAHAVFASIQASGGRAAQFDHPDLGGHGQWMPGMTQVGDMFDTALRARVEGLCTELAALAQSGTAPASGPSAGSPAAGVAREPQWWPDYLPWPDVTGGQNDVRYAWFAAARRLVVERDGRVTLYDTGDHRISGVSQSQHASHRGLTFSTPRGTLDVDSLPVVDK